MPDEPLTASLEDYLEGMYQIVEEKEGVRPKDIARRLNVSNASVTGALRALSDRKLINYSPHEIITFTHKGRALARDIIRRHEVLRDFFVRILAADPDDAEQAACRMEHAISPAILERFVRFADFVHACPLAGAEWEAGFTRGCRSGRSGAACEACLASALDTIRRERAGGVRSDEAASQPDDAPIEPNRVPQPPFPAR